MARFQINTRSIEGTAFIVKPQIFAAFKYILRAIYFMAIVREILDWLDNSSYTNRDKENIFKKELIEEPDGDSTKSNNDGSASHDDYGCLNKLSCLSNQPSKFLGDGSIPDNRNKG